MKLVKFSLVASALAAALALAVTVPSAGQELPLTEKAAEKAIKAQDMLLRAAEKAQKRGDNAAVAQNIEEFTAGTRQLHQSLASGQVADDDILDVAERVDKATQKQLEVLNNISTRFNCGTDQAHDGCRGILQALEVAGTGHDAATAALTNHARVDLAGGVLNDRAARGAMEKNNALLNHAERAQRRGDNAGVNRSVDQYTANINAVGRALEEGEVDEAQAVSVFDRVDRNTRRHVGVLEGLLGKVPEQARASIERALAASRKGNEAATAALARTPAAGVSAGRPGSAGPPSGVGGAPGGAGGGPPGGKPPAGPPGGKPPGGPPK